MFKTSSHLAVTASLIVVLEITAASPKAFAFLNPRIVAGFCSTFRYAVFDLLYALPA